MDVAARYLSLFDNFNSWWPFNGTTIKGVSRYLDTDNPVTGDPDSSLSPIIEIITGDRGASETPKLDLTDATLEVV